MYHKKLKVLVALFLGTATLTACAQTPVPVNSHYETDVIHMTQQQLTPKFWLNKLEPEQPLMNAHEIKTFNDHLLSSSKHIVDPLAMPSSLNKAQLTKKINSISAVPKSARFYFDGTKLTDSDYNQYLALLNRGSIAPKNQLTFGLVLKRSVLRTFPTLDAVYKRGSDRDLDRFQESGIFPGEVVALLHTSSDGKWGLVQSYNYLAWMPLGDLAIGDKEQIIAFTNSTDFIVVTGDKVFTNHVPQQSQLSNVQLDMGTRLPLASPAQYSDILYGQNPYANYVVQFPTRNEQGNLSIELALIARSQDVSIGYMPFTKKNLVKQSFKFLGERYGWGHDYNGRDCTGFVGEIYKSFGLSMPRNSGQQGKGTYGTNIRFAKGTGNTDKLATIGALEVGDLIYISGHVMMYLGQENGEPYVIHDVTGLSYFKPDGQFYRGKLNGVSITPLLPLHLSKTTSYVDNIYNIKRIRALGSKQ